MRKIVVCVVFSSLLFTAKTSFASFSICNAKADGASMWVTYAYYVPNTADVLGAPCSSSYGVTAPAYYETWRNTGWWYLAANQCATVYAPALSNRWAYVYAEISDGSYLPNSNTPFDVSSAAFTWDQYVSGPYNCGADCVEYQTFPQCTPPLPSAWSVSTMEVDQGSYSSLTLTIN